MVLWCVCWTLDAHPFWFSVLCKEFDTHGPRITCTAVLVKSAHTTRWYDEEEYAIVLDAVRQTMNEGKDKRVLAFYIRGDSNLELVWEDDGAALWRGRK